MDEELKIQILPEEYSMLYNPPHSAAARIARQEHAINLQEKYNRGDEEYRQNMKEKETNKRAELIKRQKQNGAIKGKQFGQAVAGGSKSFQIDPDSTAAKKAAQERYAMNLQEKYNWDDEEYIQNMKEKETNKRVELIKRQKQNGAIKGKQFGQAVAVGSKSFQIDPHAAAAKKAAQERYAMNLQEKYNRDAEEYRQKMKEKETKKRVEWIERQKANGAKEGEKLGHALAGGSTSFKTGPDVAAARKAAQERYAMNLQEKYNRDAEEYKQEIEEKETKKRVEWIKRQKANGAKEGQKLGEAVADPDAAAAGIARYAMNLQEEYNRDAEEYRQKMEEKETKKREEWIKQQKENGAKEGEKLEQAVAGGSKSFKTDPDALDPAAARKAAQERYAMNLQEKYNRDAEEYRQKMEEITTLMGDSFSRGYRATEKKACSGEGCG